MCRRCCWVPLVAKTCVAECYWILAGVLANRRLWQDDVKLTDDQEASGHRAPVLKSALVSSCRFGCAQSNNISTSNRAAYLMHVGSGQVIASVLKWDAIALMVRIC
ncbi:hypothetical protein cyc_07383 [Cyclospora cayetanensis]|uniref:Uncharacterized protein n=1 Tax=Cyclospora cayetanensis TaxID=88456 RepID=A0A1D3D9P1_9EIME|nr:hypothetical protein cyc_07383 [Cyclospora cayetanensis]